MLTSLLGMYVSSVIYVGHCAAAAVDNMVWICVILLRTTAVIVHGDSAECRDVPVLLGHVSLVSVTCHVSRVTTTTTHHSPPLQSAAKTAANCKNWYFCHHLCNSDV